MVQEDRTCYQLAEILCSTGYNIVHHHPNAKFANIIEQPDTVDAPIEFSTVGIENLFARLMKNYLRWKGGLFQVKSKLNINPRDSAAQNNLETGPSTGMFTLIFN